MAEVVSVRFRGNAKHYYFDPQGIQAQPGDYLIVQTAQGLEYARCAEGNHTVPDQSVVQPLRPVVRAATENDHKVAMNNRKREKEAFGICEQKIAAHGLEMKLVNVECSFEGNKIIFFFTAEGRVDFRELVKDLAGVFRARIELRQIGVRDEAKMLGGLGICGRPLCCSQFLDEFIPVSIKMAKTQNLSLNPTKISGTCGRLMCCLKYEQAAYEDAAGRMPKNESFVDTPDGVGNVSAVDLLRGEVSVRLDGSAESPKRYKSSEIRVLRNGKGSREGIEIPKDRPARAASSQEAGKESRFVRRSGVAPVPSSPVPEQDAHRDQRRHDRRRSGKGKPGASGVKPAAPASGKPQRQEKLRSDTPVPLKPGRSDRPLPVRPVSDTTAEKKAAADRAAREAARSDGRPETKADHKPRRRFYRRRGKGNS